MTDVRAFAEGLLKRGIELVVRNNRLRVWPAQAYSQLSADEIAYLAAHRIELKQLAKDNVLSETTVAQDGAESASQPLQTVLPPCRVHPPDDATDRPARAVMRTPPANLDPYCPFCDHRPCVSPSHPLFGVLHRNDPAEITRRIEHATAIMMRRLRISP